MAKADVIAAAVTATQTNMNAASSAALSDGLSAVYDQGATDQKSSDGTFTQADIDAAVASAQAVDAAALAAAQAQSQEALTGLQSQLDTLSAKETGEEALIASLQTSLNSVQASIAAILAVIPVPAAPVAPAAAPASN